MTIAKEFQVPRTALVTGASGFVGGRLVHHLVRNGWTVNAVVRPGSRSATLEVAKRFVYDGSYDSLAAAVTETCPTIVFHLASEMQHTGDAGEIERLIASNILFPTQLVEAMLATGCTRLINTGTFWQHFENESYRPVDFYAAAKQAFQDLLVYYQDARGLSCVTLKLFETYGPADPRRKLINLLIDAGLSGEPVELSPGEQILDLAHVDDVAGAFVVAAEYLLDLPTPVNEVALVSGERMKLMSLVDLLHEVFGPKLRVSLGRRAYRPREIMNPIAPRPSAALAGWLAARRFRDGIPELIASRSTTEQRDIVSLPGTSG